MCGCESSLVLISSFWRATAVSPKGGGGGRRGSCWVYDCAYLCSFRIICSRMAWSGFLLFLLSLSPPPATIVGGEDWALRGIFIVVPSGIRGDVWCVGETRPKLCRFGQLDAVRRRWKEAQAGTPNLRTDIVRLMRERVLCRIMQSSRTIVACFIACPCMQFSVLCGLRQ